MTLAQAVQQLVDAEAQTTQQIASLIQAVNTRKTQLDTAVDEATDKATEASVHAQAANEAAAEAAASVAALNGLSVVTATATVTLTTSSTVYQLIDPNGATRDVVLPALGPDMIGRAFSIKNTGTASNFLTIKTAAGVQVGPALGNGYAIVLVWAGSTWEVF